jgi:hypothetical protein
LQALVTHPRPPRTTHVCVHECLRRAPPPSPPPRPHAAARTHAPRVQSPGKAPSNAGTPGAGDTAGPGPATVRFKGARMEATLPRASFLVVATSTMPASLPEPKPGPMEKQTLSS